MGMGMDPDDAPVRFVHKQTSEMGATQEPSATAGNSMGGELDGELDFEDMNPMQQVFILLLALLGVGYVLFFIVL